MQAQREVGIFGRIVRRARDGDFVKSDLVCAFAAKLFVGNTLDPKESLGQFMQRNAAVGFEHVGLQHGVVGDAAQIDPFIGKDVRVVFGVMQHFGRPVVFQPGPEPRENIRQRQLPLRIGAPVRDRDVTRNARFDR